MDKQLQKICDKTNEFDNALKQTMELCKELHECWRKIKYTKEQELNQQIKDDYVVEEFEEAIAMMAKLRAAKNTFDAIYTMTKLYN